jgi:hypothetical protein
LALVIWPFVLSMIAAILHKYPYGGSARLDQHLAPAICLLLGNGVGVVILRFAPASERREDRETRRHGDRRTTVVLQGYSLVPFLLLVAFGVTGLIRDVVKPFKTTAELWNRDLVQGVMARAGPMDQVVIFNAPHEVRPGLEWYFRQHDERIRWRGDIDWDRLSTGKIWCVEVFFDKPTSDPILNAIAHSGRSLVRADYYQSLGPPEHGDLPELAEVYCFVVTK